MAKPGLDEDWKGQDGNKESSGFRIFKNATVGQPKIWNNDDYVNDAESAKKLLAKKIVDVLEAEGLKACAQWNHDCCLTGNIPVTRYLEDNCPRGEWGRLCEVGATVGKMGLVRHLTEIFMGTSKADMWKLPEGPNQEHLKATGNVFHFSNDASLLASAPLPLMGYKDIPARRRPVANHPNNVGRRRLQLRSQDEESEQGAWRED